MGIARKIVSIMEKRDLRRAVKRAQFGLSYCAVELESGEAGVAYSFPRKDSGPSMKAGGNPIGGTPALEAARFLGSENLFDSAIGLAAVNALVAAATSAVFSAEKTAEEAQSSGDSGDVLEALDLREGDRVCMVGCFFPVLEKLRQKRVEVQAVDLESKPGALPAESVSALLPESQVALITATAVINGTIEGLLELAGNCREVAVLGPSTPLIPRAFVGTPVSCLAGIRVDDADEVFRVIGEGGGFRDFKRYTTKVTLRVPAAERFTSK